MRRSGLVRTPPSTTLACLGQSRQSCVAILSSPNIRSVYWYKSISYRSSSWTRLISTPAPSSPAHHAPSSHPSSTTKHAPRSPHRRAMVTTSHHAMSHSPVSHAVPMPPGYDDGTDGLRMTVCCPTRGTESEAHVVRGCFPRLGVFEDIFCESCCC